MLQSILGYDRMLSGEADSKVTEVMTVNDFVVLHFLLSHFFCFVLFSWSSIERGHDRPPIHERDSVSSIIRLYTSRANGRVYVIS
jgi:hypothetical protein